MKKQKRNKSYVRITFLTVLCFTVAMISLYIVYGIVMYIVDISLYKDAESRAATVGWTDELVAEAKAEEATIERMAEKNFAYNMAYEARHDIWSSGSKYVVLLIVAIVCVYSSKLAIVGMYNLTIVRGKQRREEKADAKIQEELRQELKEERLKRECRHEERLMRECLEIVENIEKSEDMAKYGFEVIDLDEEWQLQTSLS